MTLTVLVFTNADLFFGNIVSSFKSDTKKIKSIKKSDIYQNNDIAGIMDSNDVALQNVKDIIKKYQSGANQTNPVAESLESKLKSKLKDYPFKFNTLPPTNRVIIPSLGLDIPLVVSASKEIYDFTKGNFDEELTKGVVKYPTTPDPGKTGNMLIFGHTSQEWRKKNPYGTIFAKIPDLKNGDTIQIVWEGNLYEYSVIDRIIVTPKYVNGEYMKYQSGQFLTLMGCYPLGTDKNRLMIFAKLKK